jgi:hypothetical protein
MLADVTVWSSTVENECDRTCAIGRAPVVGSAGGCWVEASSAPTAGSGGGGVGSERGVLAPYRLCSHSLLAGRRYESRVALSGGVWGGKTKGSGCTRLRWFPGRMAGLHGEVSVLWCRWQWQHNSNGDETAEWRGVGRAVWNAPSLRRSCLPRCPRAGGSFLAALCIHAKRMPTAPTRPILDHSTMEFLPTSGK